MRSVSRLIPCLALMLSLPLTGCADLADPGTSGVEIPLLQTGAGGIVYRLNADFEITTPSGTHIALSGAVNEPSITVNLDPGVHLFRLVDGWSLERSSDGGATFTVVGATLGSINPLGIRVVPNRTVTLGFEFIVREVTGNVRLTFGVVDPPRQLSGGVRFTEGFGVFASYAGATVDVQIYFSLDSQTLATEADGSRTRAYSSFINALDFFNDTRGALAPLGPTFSGGGLTFTTRIRPDGTQDFSGDYQAFQNGFPEIIFGTSTFASIPVDSNGFPADTAFVAAGSPITIMLGGDVALRGRVSSIRQFL